VHELLSTNVASVEGLSVRILKVGNRIASALDEALSQTMLPQTI